MNAKATWKEYSLAGGVSDDTTSFATDAFEEQVDGQLAGGTPELAQLPGDSNARRLSPRGRCHLDPSHLIEEEAPMLNGERKIARPLRWAMVGGGRLSQVGYKHRCGALEGQHGVPAGRRRVRPRSPREAATSAPPSASIRSAATPTTDPVREEAKRRGRRRSRLDRHPERDPLRDHRRPHSNAGLHVICEKPLFFTTEEVREVKALAESKGLIVGVTYGFSGHPLLAADARDGRQAARSATCAWSTCNTPTASTPPTMSRR